MTLGVLCSGQGGQHAGMFALTGEEPRAAEVYAYAASLLGQDPRELVRCAAWDTLHRNKTAQVLCTVQALAAATALSDDIPASCCVTGYSVGEVATWSIAGRISALDTLTLVAARADAMQAARIGEQGMLFVRGLSRAVIEQLCDGREAAIAIFNPGNAFVVGGDRLALRGIATEALSRGAARVVPIAVEVASHTYLLASASPVFRRNLAATPLARAHRPGARLLSGIDGLAVLNVQEGLEKLALQLSQPVQWAACLDSCAEAGVRAFLELGPGRALTAMATEAYPSIPARSIDDFHSLQGVREWLYRVL
jgi:[acyl-carrier-protein] S-malonyltransferase